MPRIKMRHLILKHLVTVIFYLPLSFKVALCHLGARILARKKMHIAQQGLSYALPALNDQQQKIIAEEAALISLKNLVGFCHHAHYAYEIIDQSAFSHIASATTGGIIMCPHMGVYDGVTWLLNQKGIRTKTIFGAGKSGDRIDENIMITQAAHLAKIPHLLRQDNLLIALLEQIKQGYWIVLHMDMRTKGVPVEWFGQKTELAPTPFFLAHKLGCPIYFHYALTSGNIQKMHFSSFKLEHEGTLSEKIVKDAQKLASAMEIVIRTHPAQWIWQYRRWT
ncbi:MAG: lysophospholipid acyltransferase family protein [Vibrio ordalii]|uniref:lysophospholipid acyltransferase family protein n=1 Tax=Vibrio ordalii TaxID=28174 RepID=UPI003F2D0330